MELSSITQKKSQKIPPFIIEIFRLKHGYPFLTLLALLSKCVHICKYGTKINLEILSKMDIEIQIKTVKTSFKLSTYVSGIKCIEILKEEMVIFIDVI